MENQKIKLKRPGMDVGDSRELSSRFDVPSFELYGRVHEVTGAQVRVRVTKLAEGLHLDLEVTCNVTTSCDRTLEPTELTLTFGVSEFLEWANDPELYVEDWELDVTRFTEEALPSEVPMQVFCPGTEPVRPDDGGDEIDPRWRALDGIRAAGL